MIYAIGDIHGQVDMLQQLLLRLEDLPLAPDDRLVFVGDYIDRGVDSCGVIETLIDLRARRPNTVFLRGNHEQLLFDARDSEPPRAGSGPGQVLVSDAHQLWMHNGGDETLFSYRDEFTDEEYLTWWDMIPETHWEFYRSTQIQFDTDRYLFVHAGLLPPGKSWEGMGRGMDERLWIREPFISSKFDFGKVVVFGHTPMQRPLIEKTKIGIDTGAVFGGALTAAGVDGNARARKLSPPHIIQITAG